MLDGARQLNFVYNYSTVEATVIVLLFQVIPSTVKSRKFTVSTLSFQGTMVRQWGNIL